MTNRHYCLFISISCFVLTIAVKIVRRNMQLPDEMLNVVYGSLPSFLFIVGILFLIPVFKKEPESSAFWSYTFGLTVGALVYELEQNWTSRAFDYKDIVATLIGVVCVYLISLLWNFKEN